MKNAHAAIALCALMALAVGLTWQMWLNPAVDSGREMNTPLRLLEGELLYSQVYNLYGPLAPLCNSALYALFGAHLNTLYWAGILGSLLLVLSVFRLGRFFMSPFESMLAALAVLALCVFKESGNLIFPYSFAVLYGTLAGTAALIAMARCVRGGGNGALWAAGLLSGLALCCKAEFGLAVTAAAAALILTEPRGRRLRAAGMVAAGFSIIPLTIGIFLFTRIPIEAFVRDTFLLPGSIPDALIRYNRLKLGFFEPGRTLRELISSAALLAGCAGLFSLAAGRRARRPSETGAGENGARPRALLCLTLACWAWIGAHFLFFGTRWDLNPFRALPLLLLGAVLYAAVRLVRRRGDPVSVRVLLVVSVYALAILARVVTRVPAGGGYGAALLPVPLVLFTWMALSDAFIFKVPSAARPARRRALRVFLSVALTAILVLFVSRYKDHKSYRVETPRGGFTASAGIGPAVSQTLEFIGRNSGAGEYILALPEGSSLNFLSGRPAPLRHEVMTPGFLDRRAELDAIRTLEEKNVRLVFLFNRPTSEFGAEKFGRDYCRTLWRWIESNYALDAVFGDGAAAETEIGDPAFFIKCFKKK
ncbi:MAG: glycosyltransferase family 39 protein [Acidobacteria bacterium]|nr:glycosyltransferase family 39 protein [Acidobacteriota bacterium]